MSAVSGATLAAPALDGAAVSRAAIGANATAGRADVVLVEFRETSKPRANASVESAVVRFTVTPAADAANASDARGRRRLKRLQGDAFLHDVVTAYALGRSDASRYEFVLPRLAPAANVGEAAATFYVDCAGAAVDGRLAGCAGFTASEVRAAVCANATTSDGFGRATQNATVEVNCGVDATPACLRYAEGVEDWDATSCYAVAETATNTTCSCEAAPSGDYASSTSGSAYLTYYEHVFRNPLSASLVANNGPFLKLCGAMLGVWLVFAAIGVVLDRRDRERAAEAAGRPARPEAGSRPDHLADLASALPSRLQRSRACKARYAATGDAKKGARLAHYWHVADLVRRNHEWVSPLWTYEASAPRAARCFLACVDMLSIGAVCAAVTLYSFPLGLCEAEETEASCERIRSTASWDAGSACAWDANYEVPCTFAAPEGAEAISVVAQTAVIAVTLALPLIHLSTVLSERYLFKPTAGATAKSRDEAAVDAACQRVGALGNAARREAEAVALDAEGARRLLNLLGVDGPDDLGVSPVEAAVAAALTPRCGAS